MTAKRRLTLLALALALSACDNKPTARVRIDGSSTVFPITEAVAEEFRNERSDIRVTVGVSGTGGGFKKFVLGETDINDASRPIKPSEIAKCKAKSIGFIELPVAYDGLSVVVHPENDWLDYITVEELRAVWKPESAVKTWKDVRASWPDRPIKLFGAGTDSGTFDYFTEVIVGKARACRSDYTASEDDNVIVTGISGNKDALGFFGFAYYKENKDRLKIAPIKNGEAAPVAPSVESIEDGTYAPLSRPVFIYVSTSAAGRPEVKAFIDFYLDQAPALVGQVGYVALPAALMGQVKARFAALKTGTMFGEGSPSLTEALKR